MQKRLIEILSSERTAERIAIVVFIIILGLVSFGLLSYNDFWWHLAAGKWMFTTHSFLTKEIFSFVFQGKEWLNSTWLYDALVFCIYSISSFLGLSVLRFVIFAGSYAAIIAAARIKYKPALTFCLSVFLLTVPLIRNFLRPEITQPLFVGIFLYALYAYKYRRSRIIFILPIIELLWVNIHGSFTMGIVLIGIFLFSEFLREYIKYRRTILSVLKNSLIRTYGIVLAATAAATLLNPIGYRIYFFISAILADQESLRSIAEWSKFSFANLFNFSTVGAFPLGVLASASIVALYVRIVRSLKDNKTIGASLQRLIYEDIFILLFFLLSMLNYIRLVPLFTVIAAFIIIKNYPAISKKESAQTHLLGVWLLPVSLVVFFAASQSMFRLNTGPNDFDQAKESIEFVKKNRLPGHILNEYADGGELIWQLYPDYQIYIDGRTPNVYDNSFYWYYRNLGTDNILDAVTKRYNISFAVVPITSGLGDVLSQSDKWTMVFFDNYEYVFLRNATIDSKLIDANNYTILSPRFDDKHYIEICKNKETKAKLFSELDRNMRELAKPVYSMTILATMLNECPGATRADLQHAEELMQRAITYKSSDPVLYYKLGTIQVALDESEAARRTFETSIGLQKNATNIVGLGIALHNLGQYAEAEKIFQDVPFLPGSNAVPNEYYQIYGRVEYQLDRNAKAIELFHRYLDLVGPDKIIAQDYLDLSNAYKDNLQSEESRRYSDMAKNFLVPTSTKDILK